MKTCDVSAEAAKTALAAAGGDLETAAAILADADLEESAQSDEDDEARVGGPSVALGPSEEHQGAPTATIAALPVATAATPRQSGIVVGQGPSVRLMGSVVREGTDPRRPPHLRVVGRIVR